MNSRQRRRTKRQRRVSILKRLAPASRVVKRYLRKHLLALLGILIPILAAFVIYYLSYAEPDIRVAARFEVIKTLDEKPSLNGDITSYFVMRMRFKNLSVKPGYVDKIELVPLLLNQRPITVIEIPKIMIHWREERDVDFKVAFTSNPRQYIQMYGDGAHTMTHEFKIYDNTGQSITRSIYGNEVPMTFGVQFSEKGYPN